MPAIQKVIPRRGREFWHSLDPDDLKQVVEAVMSEYDRSDPDQVHYSAGESPNLPLTVCGPRISLPCFRDCQIFLLYGAVLIEGQGRLVDTCCSYIVKDEEWIGLCGSKTVIVVMEEGEQRGACRKKTLESQKRLLAERSKPGNKCIIM